MPREVTFEQPLDPSQFGPEQLRPRALLALAMNGLGRWFATFLVPYSRLLSDHRTGLVFTVAHLRRTPPDLRFRDADWLAVAARVSVSGTAKYLRLEVGFQARSHSEVSAHRQVASFRAHLRVVDIAEDQAMTAVPGVLPDHLLGLLDPSDLYRPDRAALAAASSPPTGVEVFADDHEAIMCRSDCEVADQWSFIEVVELATRARERLYRRGTVPVAIARLAVAEPVGRIDARFDGSLYVFDDCSVTTRVLVEPSHDVVFVHTFTDTAHRRRCATVWETLHPGPDAQRLLKAYAPSPSPDLT
jgi:hypothetical protein